MVNLDNIEKSIEKVKTVLNSQFEHEYNNKQVRDNFLQEYHTNKNWLFPFFDENGRLEMTVPKDQVNLSSEDNGTHDIIKSSLYKLLSNKAEKNPNSPIVQIHQDYQEFSRDLIHFISAFLDFFKNDEVIENKVKNKRVLDKWNDEIERYEEGQLSIYDIIFSISNNTDNIKDDAENKDLQMKININMKLSKILNKIPPHYMISGYFNRNCISALNYEEKNIFFNEIKDITNVVLSMVVQDLQTLYLMDIKVVLSINPLDMLLVSDHTSGWDSCHRLDGCHRAGSMSYLTDSVTATGFAYMKKRDFYYDGQYSSSRTKLIEPDYPVKLWRQNVHFDAKNSSAVFARQYTKNHDNLKRILRKLAAMVLAQNANIKFDNIDEVKWTKNNSYDIDFIGPGYHDDDMTCAIILDGGNPPRLYAGNEYLCPVCGRGHVHEPGAESFVCDECMGAFRCDRCDDVYFDEDGIETHNGDTICEYCYNNYYATCDECDNVFLQDDLIELDGNYFCGNCHDDIATMCELCNDVVDIDNITNINGINICENCFTEKVSACENCNHSDFNENLYEHEGSIYCYTCYNEVILQIEEAEKVRA